METSYIHCLNPCCSGLWSRTSISSMLRMRLLTGLNPYCSGQWSRTPQFYVHRQLVGGSLNPYCSGQWSRTAMFQVRKLHLPTVLILIVVDNGLVLYYERIDLC